MKYVNRQNFRIYGILQMSQTMIKCVKIFSKETSIFMTTIKKVEHNVECNLFKYDQITW